MILPRLVTTVAALAATATAGVMRRDADAVMAVNATTFANLKLYEQYAAATYCTVNDIAAPGTPIRCPAGNCPDVEAALATSTFSFDDLGVDDVTGFISVNDPATNIIVLAFRGTRSIENGITKLDTRLVDTTLCGTGNTGCQVHEGFLDSWLSVQGRITQELVRATTAHTGLNTLIVTGHGTGGSLATLAATYYRNTNTAVAGLTTVQLYTYGSPRVGNVPFATFVVSQGGGTGGNADNFRVTHTDDPIPKFPSRSLGYLQWGPEYWIRAPTGQPVHPNDIDEIDGVETSQGNSGTPPSFDIPAHLWYFNAIEACV